MRLRASHVNNPLTEGPAQDALGQGSGGAQGLGPRRCIPGREHLADLFPEPLISKIDLAERESAVV